MIKSWDYIKLLFKPKDLINIVLINNKTGQIKNEFLFAEEAAALKSQKRYRYYNAKGYSVYVGMNPIKIPQSGKLSDARRTKENIAEIRHIYVEIDHNGKENIARIQKAVEKKEVPQPNFILESSPNKYQVVWKVEVITKVEAEKYNHFLVKKFGGDSAATDCSRVLRVTGFRNKKYENSPLVVGKKYTNKIAKKGEFKIKITNETQTQITKKTKRKENNNKFSQSENDWKWVTNEIKKGRDLKNIQKELENFRQDKANPKYYAEYTVKKASDYVFAEELIKKGTNSEIVKKELIDKNSGEVVYIDTIIEKIKSKMENQNGKKIKDEHKELLKALGRIGVIGYEHTKCFSGGYKKILDLKKMGLVEQISGYVSGRKNAVYILTDKGKNFVRNNYGVDFKHIKSIVPSSFPHQLKLADVYFQKSHAERESWKSESTIFREMKEKIKKGVLSEQKLDCPDACYTNSEGVYVAVEVITKNYRKGQIENKRSFAKKHFGDYEEYNA
jgi:hypothetical protein